MTTKEQIGEKVNEMVNLERNINAINQRLQQFQNELQNLNNQRASTVAQVIRLEGYFEGAEVDWKEERNKIDKEKRDKESPKKGSENKGASGDGEDNKGGSERNKESKQRRK